MKKVIIDNIHLIKSRKIYTFVLGISFSLLCLYTFYIYFFSDMSFYRNSMDFFPLSNFSMKLTNNLTLYLLPLVSTLLVADLSSIQKEMEVFLFTRLKKNQLYFGYLIASFIVGFGFMLFLLISVYCISIAAYDMKANYFIQQSIINLQSPSSYKIPFLHLMINYPILRDGLYILLISIYSGLLASLGYAVSLFYKRKYMVSLYIFITSLFFVFLPHIFSNGVAVWYPQNIFLADPILASNPGSLTIEMGILFWLCMLVIIPLGLVFIKSKHEEM